MKRFAPQQEGSAHLWILVAVLVIALVSVTAFKVYKSQNPNSSEASQKPSTQQADIKKPDVVAEGPVGRQVNDWLQISPGGGHYSFAIPSGWKKLEFCRTSYWVDDHVNTIFTSETPNPTPKENCSFRGSAFAAFSIYENTKEECVAFGAQKESTEIIPGGYLSRHSNTFTDDSTRKKVDVKQYTVRVSNGAIACVAYIHEPGQADQSKVIEALIKTIKPI